MAIFIWLNELSLLAKYIFFISDAIEEENTEESAETEQKKQWNNRSCGVENMHSFPALNRRLNTHSCCSRTRVDRWCPRAIQDRNEQIAKWYQQYIQQRMHEKDLDFQCEYPWDFLSGNLSYWIHCQQEKEDDTQHSYVQQGNVSYFIVFSLDL